MDVAGKNLVFEVVTEARLVVSCQFGGVPTDHEWDNWLASTTHLLCRFNTCRLLVLSERGHPTGAQIERLRATGRRMLEKGYGYPQTAIISTSAAMRLFVNALMCINPTIRCFSPADRQKAFDHLGLARDEANRAVVAMDRLRARLSGPQLPC
jgi:hypothetical protein